LLALISSYLAYNTNTTFRVKGSHAFLKRYLGSKKTQGDLFTTWSNIEAVIRFQIKAIQTKETRVQDYCLLDIDNKKFCAVIGVVT
jgi:hypothetical protein